MNIESLIALTAELDRFDKLRLVTQATETRQLKHAFPAGNVWLKDDSVSHSIYGGNKPRKLEYLLSQAKRLKRPVLTFGYTSSNHGVATAYHCKKNDIECHLVLIRSDHDDAKNLKLMREHSTSVEIVSSIPGAVVRSASKWLSLKGRVYVVPPGASNARGTLGYVRAALEFAAQVARQEASHPNTVYVPLGTAGTAVGLAIGFAAGGLKTKVVAVKVVPGQLNERARLLRLSKKVHKLLPSFNESFFSLANLEIDRDELGQGYGASTLASQSAVDRWRLEENVVLETTYTGKAAAALERRVREDEVSLFWLTYSEFR